MSNEKTTTKKQKLTLIEKQQIKLKQQKIKNKEKAKRGAPANEERYYCTNKELMAELEKWRDSHESIQNRIISEQLGLMFMAIGKKLLNHSNFRNYSTELKEDMLMFGIEKIIKGLKNYNFQFTNPFAWVTQAFYNAYLTIITKHYKQINIKKDLLKKLSIELDSYSGISSASSLNKYIKNYISENEDCI